ncbi:MAG TPA: redox-sensing transcriptional repressor Rex [Kiritimatiellia bacterium]|nr:MAG: Redox-sensing transcriptional repressor Rex [Verrucomicrobia bacterium ADurb.Bin018]HOE01361.1 redox-sensing transcriptional repressor Rex [Kiritimatiellia bacterium]HOE35912.1 redox-sensing transcriptional repressor Rex [Kiritimatiellia bacterium]HOR73856.1 redox-sensing transcriptional repressor Rex [Kiritimatiellia bacterium]HOU58505.1 redox-sensing transcriptional repressor Rex [Kiritimatiellia bacterium]
MSEKDFYAQKDLIKRLVRYKNILLRLKSMGLSRVFSDNLGDAAGVSSSLVRKDFSLASLAVGNKRGGYSIDLLLRRLDDLLGAHDVQRIIIVGCGKIGTALLNYKGFSNENIQVVAGFDNDPARINPANTPIPILPISQLEPFCQEQSIQVAVLAVPEKAAAGILDKLSAAGIRGVLNFSPVQLKAGSALFIQNINIAFEIENLFYHVRFNQRQANAGS